MEEHFSELEPNVIESSTGFSVRVLGRTGMQYTEGERSVWIDSEVLATPRAIAMFKETIRAWEGPDPAEVSATERDRIAGNIKRAFDACGYDLQVQEPFDWDSGALRPPHQPGELLISSCLALVAASRNVHAIRLKSRRGLRALAASSHPGGLNSYPFAVPRRPARR